MGLYYTEASRARRQGAAERGADESESGRGRGHGKKEEGEEAAEAQGRPRLLTLPSPHATCSTAISPLLAFVFIDLGMRRKKARSGPAERRAKTGGFFYPLVAATWDLVVRVMGTE